MTCNVFGGTLNHQPINRVQLVSFQQVGTDISA